MMELYKTLREEAYEANMEIPKQRLAMYTWGNASAFDPGSGVFAIKPSGVGYDELTPDSMVIVDLDGKTVDGRLKPSSDTKTHLVLYRSFTGIRGVTHAHSTYATAWAQACASVPVFGTTHADFGDRPVPCTDYISVEALSRDYELETGNLIVEKFKKDNLDPIRINMVLVAGHGPFTWGKDAADAVYHAAVLEEVCRMALLTLQINPRIPPLPEHILRKHLERKHGANAYYGQIDTGV
jgi:L-ribulose-5-phosphate 4-epimerase